MAKIPKINDLVTFKNRTGTVTNVLTNSCIIDFGGNKEVARLDEVVIKGKSSKGGIQVYSVDDLKTCVVCQKNLKKSEFPKLRGDKLRDQCRACWGDLISQKKEEKSNKDGIAAVQQRAKNENQTVISEEMSVPDTSTDALKAAPYAVKHVAGINNIRSIAADIASLLIRKNADYGNAFFEILEKRGSTYLFDRLYEKVRRGETISTATAKINESIEDTLMDVAGYAILGLYFLEERRK